MVTVEPNDVAEVVKGYGALWSGTMVNCSLNSRPGKRCGLATALRERFEDQVQLANIV